MKSSQFTEKFLQISSPRVSVIIPTCESAEMLERCMKSLKEQSHLSHEIIVVDSFSKDETRDIASHFGGKVFLKVGTQASARNVGLANSKGDYVLFLDGDQQLETRVIEDCLSTCSRLGVDAVIIPEVFVGLKFFDKCSALWKNRMVEAWGLEGGIPRFYRRDVLTRSSAFDEELRLWEDMELYRRLKTQGIKTARCNARVVHYETSIIKDVVRKYVSYGRSMNVFRKKTLKAPLLPTVKLTVSTMTQVFLNPGRSLKTFVGCLFLVALKGISVSLGFLTGLRDRS